MTSDRTAAPPLQLLPQQNSSFSAAESSPAAQRLIAVEEEDASDGWGRWGGGVSLSIKLLFISLYDCLVKGLT